MEPFFTLFWDSYPLNLAQQWEEETRNCDRRQSYSAILEMSMLATAKHKPLTTLFIINYTGTLVGIHKQTELFYRFPICDSRIQAQPMHWRLETNFFYENLKICYCVPVQFEWGNCVVERWTSKSIYSYLSENWTLKREYDVQHTHTHTTLLFKWSSKNFLQKRTQIDFQ